MITRHIPTDARDEIDALKYGRDEAQFLDHMWSLRYPDRPRVDAIGAWPFKRVEQSATVTPFRRKGK